MSPAFVAFVLIGFGAQLIDGALGMAYGATSATLLLTIGLAPAVASATVHIAEVGTTLASGVSHWRFGNLNRDVTFALAIPGGIGAFLGAVVLSNVSADLARPLVSTFLFGLGLLLLVRFARPSPATRAGYARGLSRRFLSPLGLVGGFLDAAGGGGWGPIVTPTLLASGRMRPRKAVGNADASEFVVALCASTGFFVALDLALLDPSIVLAILLGGLAAAPVAAWLVRRLPARLLGISVAGLILVTNGARALDAVGLTPASALVVAAVVATVWLVALVLTVRAVRRGPDVVAEVAARH